MQVAFGDYSYPGNQLFRAKGKTTFSQINYSIETFCDKKLSLIGL